MKNLILTLSLIFLFSQFINAQVNEDWSWTYISGGTDETGRKVRADNLGNVYSAGTIQSSTGSDCILIKHDSKGNVIWQKIYNNATANMNDGVNSIELDQSGNIYLCGSTFYFESAIDYLLIKYDSSGSLIWKREFADTVIWNKDTSFYVDDRIQDMTIDGLGNLYLTGDAGTVKYDSDGNFQWRVDHDYHIESISADADGNVYLTGFLHNGLPYPTASRDCITMKYNTSGVQQWLSVYQRPGTSDEQGQDIFIDAPGNVYVCGFSGVSFMTIKYNASGNQQWSKIWRDSTNVQNERFHLYEIEVDSAGNIYAGGVAYQGWPYNNENISLVKYNASGEQVWLRFTPGSYFRDFELFDRHIYVTGSIVGSAYDYTTFKYNLDGILQWEIRFNGTANSGDEPQSLCVDRFGNIFVTGNTVSNSGNVDMVVIKYSQLLTGVQNYSTVIYTYSISQNYPNPFNPKTIIHYQCSMYNKVDLKVYDVLGNEVAQLVSEYKYPGSYEVEFDGSNFGSGIYFYRLQVDGDVVDTKRMVLLK